MIDDRLQLLNMTNQYRRILGLEALEMSTQLMNSAQAWATTMATEGHSSHSDFGPENIAWGQLTICEAFGWWKNSPGHDAQILSEDHRYIGIGIAMAPTGCRCYVQHFSRERPLASRRALAPITTHPATYWTVPR